MRFGFIISLMLFFLISYSQNTYFQQEVNYNIQVKLDDANHSISGDLYIEYVNNSPDDLDTLWFHLWPNAYKDNSTPLAKQFLKSMGSTDFYFSNPEDKGYIDSLRFKVDNKDAIWHLKNDTIDICFILLNETLKPGKSVTIQTPFMVKIPKAGFSRLGHNNQEYQITQWYPKPAVYDNYGWHAMSYLNKGEFYSEFGTFDVFITVPENYIIAATGDLIDNENEIQWLKSQNIGNKTDGNIVSSKNLKTLHFHQEKVHDFAWFASKEFVVAADSFILQSGRKINAWVFSHKDRNTVLENSLKTIISTVQYLSAKVGEYPYNNVSVVESDLEAGGGMEYPNITVIQAPENYGDVSAVIAHEVIHNWFYGILAFNERDFPYLDEGLTTFYEYKFGLLEKDKTDNSFVDILGFPIGNSLKIPKVKELYYPYIFMNSRGLDQRINAESDLHTSINYFAIVYYKSALAFLYLNNFLGDEAFDNSMKTLFEQWKFKHPSPENVRHAFELNSKTDLSWFFDDIIGTNKSVDYKLSSLKTKKEKYILSVKNIGSIQSPIFIELYDKNDSLISGFWKPGFVRKSTFELSNTDIAKISLNSEMMTLDINESNNMIKASGLFKSMNKQKFHLAYALPKPGIDYHYYLPVISKNQNNGFMLGALFYNEIGIEKKFEYRLLPMYGFKSKNLVGEFGLYRNYHHISNSLRKISLGVTGKKYSYSAYNSDLLNYYKIEPELKIYLRSPRDNAEINKILTISVPYISKEDLIYIKADTGYVKSIADYSYTVITANFSYHNRRLINPYSFHLDGQYHKDFIKLSLESKYRINYNSSKSGLDIRFFAGKIFNPEINNYLDYRLKMSNLDGIDDYLFNSTHLARGNDKGLFSRSMILAEGGFSVPTVVGTSDNWLMAVNLKSSLYKLNLIKLYFNAGTYYNAKNAFTGSQALMYEGGVILSIVKDILEIHYPLVYSSDIKQVLDLNNNNKFNYKLRFIMNFNAINPFKLLREINL